MKELGIPVGRASVSQKTGQKNMGLTVPYTDGNRIASQRAWSDNVLTHDEIVHNPQAAHLAGAFRHARAKQLGVRVDDVRVASIGRDAGAMRPDSRTWVLTPVFK